MQGTSHRAHDCRGQRRRRRHRHEPKPPIRWNTGATAYLVFGNVDLAAFKKTPEQEAAEGQAIFNQVVQRGGLRPRKSKAQRRRGVVQAAEGIEYRQPVPVAVAPPPRPTPRSFTPVALPKPVSPKPGISFIPAKKGRDQFETLLDEA